MVYLGQQMGSDAQDSNPDADERSRLYANASKLGK
jgi:hypothetical protein